MNLAALSAQVGNITSSQSSTVDTGFVNEAAHQVYTASRWSWLESKMSVALVAGQKGYVIQGTSPVVTDCDGVYAVELVLTASGAAVKLPYFPPQLFSRTFAHCFTQSEPSGWTILGGTAATSASAVVSGGQQSLTLNYPPTATTAQGVTLNVYYWRSGASIEMSATTDVPLAPAPLHSVIVDKACEIAMTRNLQDAAAAMYQRKYLEGLQAAIESDKANRFSDFEQMEMRPVPVGDPRGAAVKAQNSPYPVAS